MSADTVKKSIGMKRKERDSDKLFEFIDSPSAVSINPPAEPPDHGEESGDGNSQENEEPDEHLPQAAPPSVTLPFPQPPSLGEALGQGEENHQDSTVASSSTVASLAAIVRPESLLNESNSFVPASTDELQNIRSLVRTITQGIGELQQTLQQSPNQWHFNHLVGQLSLLSQDLSGEVEQTTFLYTLLQNHNLLDEMNRKGVCSAGFFSVLPEECILHALSFLSERDLASVAQLNRQFKRLAEDDAIWRLLAMRRWKKARERGREKASKRRRHAWREYFMGRRHIDANWRTGTYSLRTITGHDNQLYCLQFDEDKIVSGSEDETMKVWDIASGKCLKTLRGHTSGVWCLQFWQDRLLSGSEDSTIRFWDLETGNCEHVLNGHKYGVWSLQFDDRILVSGAEDQTIKLWDMTTLQCMNTLLGHKSDIWCLQFDAAQQMIVSGSGYEDRTLKIWDMRTCTCVMTLTGHMGAVNSLCVFYGPQNHPHRILSGSADQTIKVWDRRMGQCETTLEGHQGEVLCLKMADTRNPRIVSGGGSTCKTIKVWEDWYSELGGAARHNRTSLSLSGHDNGVWGLQYDEDKIISGSADKTIKIWDFSCIAADEYLHQEHVEASIDGGDNSNNNINNGGAELMVGADNHMHHQQHPLHHLHLHHDQHYHSSVREEEEEEEEEEEDEDEEDEDGEGDAMADETDGRARHTGLLVVRGKRKREDDDDATGDDNHDSL